MISEEVLATNPDHKQAYFKFETENILESPKKLMKSEIPTLLLTFTQLFIFIFSWIEKS